MSDSIIVPIYRFIKGCGTKYSNVTWATGFTSPIAGYTARDGQEMGWDNSRTYLFEALTSKDASIREEKFVKTFKSVGMVVHLLQDMAVPAHVRNDMSSHLINSTKWGSNPFEYFVIENFGAINNTPIKPVFVTPIRLTDFWDTTQYKATENPTVTLHAGLAEYTNANFVSDYTLFKSASWDISGHSFTYPAETSTIITDSYIQDPLYPLDPGKTIPRKYYVKNRDGETNGGAGYKLAGVGYITAKVKGGRTGTTIKDLPPMDDYVHADYAKLLLPRAVGYSAALLDYFFRGTLNLTFSPVDVTFRTVKVTVSNSTPVEAMGTGEVALVIRYKALAETGSGPVMTLSNPSTDYSYKVAKLQKVNMASQQELTFDFSNDPLPLYFDDISMQLVYRGPLGNESDSVAVSPLTPLVDGIYSDFYLLLPESGVYAKATDNTPDASFNELQVTALTNIPGGLTLPNGKIELALEYRVATSNPFLLQPGTTEPANGYAYVFKIGEKNGINSIAQGVPTELVFDLSSAPLPVNATDVELNVIYTDTATSRTVAVGYRDISEATPIDLFNNTDYVCISNRWYPAGTHEAIAAADLAGNHDGFDNDTDTYHHNLTNIYLKLSSINSPVRASKSIFNFLEPGPVRPASMQRIGFVLTDYTLKTSFLPNWVHIEYPKDGWRQTEAATLNNATAVRIQTDAEGTFTPPPMYNMRGNLMWGSAGSVYDNSRLPANSKCNWEELPPSPAP